jgi:hypothetical protein
MRNVFPPQMSIGQRDIADIKIDVSSRNDIPVILLGLQHIFTTQPLRDAVFKILGTFKQTTDLFHRISLKTTDGVALGYFMTSQF